jgi:hypothetical protein
MKRMTLRAILMASGGLLALAGAAKATTVSYPYIDVIEEGTDAGVAATGSVPALSMQGTAVALVTGPGQITNFMTPAAFTLTARYSASLTAADGQPNDYDYTEGILTIGAAGTAPLLTATFEDLVLQSAQTSLGTVTLNYAIGASGLTYTGGTLAGTLASGEILGTFTISAYAATNGAGYVDLSQDFTGDNLTVKVGAVVPLPATLALLLSGAGLLGLLRRRGANCA